jgi:hypothetical protein
MNADLEGILVAVDAELEIQADLLAVFLREDEDLAATYTALVLALALTDPSDLLDLAFAGIVRAAKAKLAADVTPERPRAARDV